MKVVIPEFVLDKLTLFCHRQWLSKGIQYELRNRLFEDSIKDSYNRLIYPLIVRQVRSELNQNAERASIEVFATNLKKLLLMPPFRGHVILGIDPGMSNYPFFFFFKPFRIENGRNFNSTISWLQAFAMAVRQLSLDKQEKFLKLA